MGHRTLGGKGREVKRRYYKEYRKLIKINFAHLTLLDSNSSVASTVSELIRGLWMIGAPISFTGCLNAHKALMTNPSEEMGCQQALPPSALLLAREVCPALPSAQQLYFVFVSCPAQLECVFLEDRKLFLSVSSVLSS